MSDVYLKTYLERLKKVYDNRRIEFAEICEKLDDLDYLYQRDTSNGTLSAQGLQFRREKYQADKKRLQGELQAVSERAGKEFAEIRSQVDSVFGRSFRADPESFDLAAAEMLKSGIMTDEEMLSLGEKYAKQGNCAMRRLTGKYLAERAAEKDNREMQAAAAGLLMESKEYLEAADSLILLYEQAMRPNETVLSENIAKQLVEQKTAEIISQYGDISLYD